MKIISVALLGMAQVASGSKEAYVEAAEKLDWAALKVDITALFTDSQPWWPADYGNYAPFFIRLAWHCSGSYRISDGRGGCGGGRQRFDPERSWDDNTNLDKARKLLFPLKDKYGVGLSWGDLFILTGSTAIESMGGPSLGFCGGRIDDVDGLESIALGPSDIQRMEAPCLKDGQAALNGDCDSPLGATTVGLIYVNPQGPMGVPNPTGSAVDVRDTFTRMAMNDTETVALIGGGHSFGKTHGACPAGAGMGPDEDPTNPWPGLCPNGAFTTGFEGAWTVNPLKFDNTYFQILDANAWELYQASGNGTQWRVLNGTTPTAPNATDATGPRQPIMMLTSDVSLKFDADGKYQEIIKTFASDEAALRTAFEAAWYKLTTRDMGTHARCLGPFTPPPQPFQYPLPAPPSTLADFKEVAKSVRDVLRTASEKAPADMADGKPYYGAWMVQLAHQCASTFRKTDFLGGCNGARIRLDNSGTGQRNWEINQGMDKVLDLLDGVMSQYSSGLSWADLITLSGQVALEDMGATGMPAFCGGRTDAAEGDLGSEFLGPKEEMQGEYMANKVQLYKMEGLFDLTAEEFVALQARPRGAARQAALGFDGTWMADPSVLSNAYFQALWFDAWTETTTAAGKKQFISASDPGKVMMPADLVLKFDDKYSSITQRFASDNMMFMESFVSAWSKLATADRFEGPAGNLCVAAPSDGPGEDDKGLSTGAIVGLSIGGTVVAGALLAGGVFMFCRRKGESDYNPL